MVELKDERASLQADRGSSSGRSTVLVQGLIYLLLGAALSSLGYASSSVRFNLYEVVGPVLFWGTGFALLLALPFRDDLVSCVRGLRTRVGAGVFISYLFVHLIVYGFVLEAILSAVYGVASPLTPSLIVATEVLTPASLLNTLYNLSFNPSISFTLPPALSGALSAYAIGVAVVIDVLILSNVVKTRELEALRTRRKKARSYFLLPVFGLIMGASCCISLSGLVAYALPSLISSASFAWIYNTSFFLFPAFAMAVLHINARSTDRIAETVRGLHPA